MFKNRAEAGSLLAEKLKTELTPEILKETVLLVIPRGGLVIGEQISKLLNIPLDCLVTKKIPSPQEEELAIGAIGDSGVIVWEEELCRELNVTVEYKQEIVKKKLVELEKKRVDYKCSSSDLTIKGKTVLIIDDGIATGATIKAAIKVVRNFSPKSVTVVVPVIAKESLDEIKKIADSVVYLNAAEVFLSLSEFYQEFEPVSDNEIERILNSKNKRT